MILPSCVLLVPEDQDLWIHRSKFIKIKSVQKEVLKEINADDLSHPVSFNLQRIGFSDFGLSAALSEVSPI